jgi:hypothetical protein
MNITITQEQYQKAYQFANNSVKTNEDEYAKRNQKNVTKIISDILIGKIAEYAVYNLLISKGKKCNEPDIAIYDRYSKSFDADLYSDGKKVHVKAQTLESAKAFGTSWSFQKQDVLTYKPSNDDYICLCQVNGLEVSILSFKQANYYLDMYKDPVLDKLKGIKKVIYMDSINQKVILSEQKKV